MTKQQGFTLIELMIAVMVVAILAAIAVPAYDRYQVLNAEKEAQAHMGQLEVQLERWRAKALSYSGFVPYWNGEYGYDEKNAIPKKRGQGQGDAVRANTLLYVPIGSDKTNYRYMLELLDGNSTPTFAKTNGDGRCNLSEKRRECGGDTNGGHSWIIVAYPNDKLKGRGAHKMMMRDSGTRCKVLAKGNNASNINVGTTTCQGTGVESW